MCRENGRYGAVDVRRIVILLDENVTGVTF